MFDGRRVQVVGSAQHMKMDSGQNVLKAVHFLYETEDIASEVLADGYFNYDALANDPVYGILFANSSAGCMMTISCPAVLGEEKFTYVRRVVRPDLSTFTLAPINTGNGEDGGNPVAGTSTKRFEPKLFDMAGASTKADEEGFRGDPLESIVHLIYTTYDTTTEVLSPNYFGKSADATEVLKNIDRDQFIKANMNNGSVIQIKCRDAGNINNTSILRIVKNIAGVITLEPVDLATVGVTATEKWEVKRIQMIGASAKTKLSKPTTIRQGDEYGDVNREHLYKGNDVLTVVLADGHFDLDRSVVDEGVDATKRTYIDANFATGDLIAVTSLTGDETALRRVVKDDSTLGLTLANDVDFGV